MSGYCRSAMPRFWAAPPTSPRTLRRSGGSRPSSAFFAGVAVAAALGAVFGSLAIRRQGIYFAMITLALAQMVAFLRARGAVHRWRGRHPGRAARPSLRADRSQPYADDVLFRAGDVSNRLRHHRPHDPLAVRPGASRRSARTSRARSRSATAPSSTSSSPLSCRRPSPGSPARPRRLVFQFASLTDVDWTTSGEVVLMTLLGGVGTVAGSGRRRLHHRDDGDLSGADSGSWVTIIEGVDLRRLRADLPPRASSASSRPI